MTKITTSKEFGDAIRAARANQKITQAQLAMTCDVGERFIVDLEKGKETCALNKALKVAKMLGLNISTNVLTSKK